MHFRSGQLSGLLWRVASVVPVVTTTLLTGSPATPIAAAAPAACQFLTPSGASSAIKHVIHVQFDNVHFTRDNPNVPSDLEQMPHLLDFIKDNGTLLANEHTPLIAHTADDFVTALTGVYADQHGLAVNNSFEYYDSSSIGSFNTSAFTYWTNRVAGNPANPFQMLDSAGNNLQGPWVPFVKVGCNFGAVSSANMVLENNSSDVTQVFGAGSPEANEGSPNRTNDFVGIAVHCADNTCSSVGRGVPSSGSLARPEPGTNQGFAGLFGHKKVASQVSPITQTDGTAITGFAQANGFNPSPAYTLGYVTSLLQANVPVVYGEIADAHDSGTSCNFVTPAIPTVTPAVTPEDPNDPSICGAFAPGEPGYVQKLQGYDKAFDAFFQKLDTMGVNKSNTVFVFHSDENDHYTGSAPLNPGCDGVHTACIYDRTRLGEITTDLPLLLKQQNLYDFGGGSRGAPTFTNVDLAYGMDFDTAPGLWLKGHPANGSAPVRKLEGALAKVTSPDPYTGQTEQLFRFLIDVPGLKALHIVTADNNRTPGILGFGAENHFISTSPLINATFHDTTCNHFPAATDATCLNQGFIWLHGNFEPDVNNTWAALVGPGLDHKGVDSATFADHTDLRPTIMTLTCLQDNYVHAGRAVLEDLKTSALPDATADNRGELTELGRTFKQLNAPVGEFGKAAISISTTAIKGNTGRYTSLEERLTDLVARRDALVSRMEAVLDKIPGCAGTAADRDRGERGNRGQENIAQLNERGKALLDEIQEVRRGESPDR